MGFCPSPYLPLTWNRHDADNQLRTAAYEVLVSFVTNSANDSLPVVATLSDVILQRLEQTVPMQQQVVSVEDRITLEEMQTSLASVLLVSSIRQVHIPEYAAWSRTDHIKSIIQRLEADIKPQADRIMHALLRVLSTLPPKSSVPDAILATISAVAGALEEDFLKYMDSFTPFLYSALGNQEELGLCSMAIGLVSDIARALNDKVQPYCDTFMNYLLNHLSVRRSKSTILQRCPCFANPS